MLLAVRHTGQLELFLACLQPTTLYYYFIAWMPFNVFLFFVFICFDIAIYNVLLINNNMNHVIRSLLVGFYFYTNLIFSTINIILSLFLLNITIITKYEFIFSNISYNYLLREIVIIILVVNPNLHNLLYKSYRGYPLNDDVKIYIRYARVLFILLYILEIILILLLKIIYNLIN